MAVIVDFYNTNSESIKLDKALNKIITKNIDFKEDVNVTAPSVILEIDLNVNYAYISKYKRYYYVTKTILTGKRVRYDFKVDVLMSFKNAIRNTTCTVLRNENISNAYLHDSEYKTLAYKKYVTKTFPKGLTNDCIILNTIGG